MNALQTLLADVPHVTETVTSHVDNGEEVIERITQVTQLERIRRPQQQPQPPPKKEKKKQRPKAKAKTRAKSQRQPPRIQDEPKRRKSQTQPRGEPKKGSSKVACCARTRAALRKACRRSTTNVPKSFSGSYMFQHVPGRRQPSYLRVHLDENLDGHEMVCCLMRHGFDVSSTRENGLTKADDETQLLYAFRGKRLFVTHDWRVEEDSGGQHHCGILKCEIETPPEEIARELWRRTNQIWPDQ